MAHIASAFSVSSPGEQVNKLSKLFAPTVEVRKNDRKTHNKVMLFICIPIKLEAFSIGV
jgi:hypothetical protein